MLLRLVNRFLIPYRGALVLLLILQLGATIASLYLPSLNGRIIDEGVAVGDTNFILRTGAVMLGISLAQIAATICATFLASRSASGMARDLRASVFHHVGQFSAQEVTRFGAPTLISRSTNDVTQVQTVTYMALALMVTAPIMMVGGVAMALREDVGLSWLVAVAVPLLGGFVALVIRSMVPTFQKMQKCVDQVNRILREQITGVRVVRAFVREDEEAKRFAVANAEYTATSLRVGRLMACTFPVVMLIFNASTVAVLWFGGKRVDAGAMQIGALIAFMAYLLQILMAVMMATMMSMMIPRAAVSAGRLDEVLSTDSSVVPPKSPVPIPAGAVSVALSGVGFHYPGAEMPVLRDISFIAEPGRTTAIIGSTGSGKTSLLNLIPRLYDATAGSVRLGGVDVKDAELEDVWEQVGLIPQMPYLFSGTVASNLRFGKADATDQELWDALRIAQAAGFVTAMEGRLDAEIAQGGTNVSGGQRQRLAIARALVKRPPVYLFDDSFSALDLTTDARLRAALRQVTGSATVIIVAQRVSTIADADQILVVDDGAIVGAGRHEDLIGSCETYREIVESQRSLQEVA